MEVFALAKNVDLNERFKMRFLTLDYCGKQEVYAGKSFPAGTIALDILNVPDTILDELLELTEPMMKLVDEMHHGKTSLPLMLQSAKNVFSAVVLLRKVPPFSYQDFTWLDSVLPKVFSKDATMKAHKEIMKESGELFVRALSLVAQLGFGIRDFRQALTPLIESLDDEDVSRNVAGYAEQFTSFFQEDDRKEDTWMALANVSVQYLAGEKGMVRRMHYASFPSMFRSDLFEALAVGNAPKRCPICNRFFLTTTAHRQIYCSGYAPEEYGDLTCQQVGAELGRAKREKAENNPVMILYNRTVNVIDKRMGRGTLDKDTAVQAKERARNLRSLAVGDPEYANGEYNTDMDPDAIVAFVQKK
jgi:hypothetical protein